MLLAKSIMAPIPFFMRSPTDPDVGVTGLTPTVVISKNGSPFSAPQGSVFETGGGWYCFVASEADTDTLGSLVMVATASGARPAVAERQVIDLSFLSMPQGEPLPGTLAAYLASIKTPVDAMAQKVQSLGTGQVTVVSPIDPKGLDIKIVRGDDYAAADGRALCWTSNRWPDLTGALVTFTAQHISQPASILQTAGAVLPPEGGNQTVQVELTSAQTDPLIHGAKTYWYDIEAQLASRRIVTLAKGLMSVEADVTRPMG